MTGNGSTRLSAVPAGPSVVQEELRLHGHRLSYRTAGPADQDAPVVLLIHGIAGNAAQWDRTIPVLARKCRVIAPDLLGHGQSAKPRGDYSLGAYAVGLRDVLLALEHQRATVVGHSLGGGIAMQFAYQYPMLCERLVLISSGGLGQEVHGLLKAVTWPGAELVLPLLTAPGLHALGASVGRVLGRRGWRPGPDAAEMLRSFGSLTDPAARRAFVHTIRAVIDAKGQRVSAHDRLYLAELIPTMLIWGRRDPIIPVAHAESAHAAMPGSRLEILDRVGHFPQLQRPGDLGGLLLDFIASTSPAQIELGGRELERLRELLMSGPEQHASR
jgi:pimeloyl-ACP methyl ester carboxylesterase